MSITSVVAANVRREIGLHSVTQMQMAALFGVSQPCVSMRARGVTPFTVVELVLLSRHLEIQLARLLEGVEEEPS